MHNGSSRVEGSVGSVNGASIGNSAVDDKQSRAKKRGRCNTGLNQSSRFEMVYFMCLLTSLVISNIETFFLPPKIACSFASALIIRLFC